MTVFDFSPQRPVPAGRCSFGRQIPLDLLILKRFNLTLLSLDEVFQHGFWNRKHSVDKLNPHSARPMRQVVPAIFGEDLGLNLRNRLLKLFRSRKDQVWKTDVERVMEKPVAAFFPSVYSPGMPSTRL